MKVIVFGATGSVGVYVSAILRKHDFDVVAVGRRVCDNGFFSDYGIPYYSVDIKDQSTFVGLPKDIDAVVHLAGAMPAHMKDYDPYEYTNSIVNGTLNVLEYMRKCDCNKIIFSQSIADIGYKFGTTIPIPDDVEMKFPLNTDHSIYSISKNAAVHLIEHYHVKYGFSRFVLRLPTIYAYHPNPYYYVDGHKKWLGYRFLIERAIKGETLEIWGNPQHMKEMVCIKDLVQLIENALKSDVSGGIYNVGCGHPVTFEEQVLTIVDVFKTTQRSEIIYRPEMPSSPQFILDIEKAQRELNYNPQYGIRELLEAYKMDLYEEPYAKLLGRRCDYID